MNLSAFPKLLLLAAVVVPCSAIKRLITTQIQAVGLGSEATVAAGFAEAARYEAEDKRFWTSEWATLEGELRSLASIAAQGEPDLKLPKLNQNPKSKADLIPALAMLKGLYEDGKQRVGKLNEREKAAKEKFAAKEAEHKSRLARIEARFKNGTLSVEFHTNETRDENRIWTYWSRCRERQRKQYRTGLKIQHATLDKVKKMIDMYEATIAGTADPAQVKKTLKKVAPPEIVFLQGETVRSVATFCKEALAEVQAEAIGGSTGTKFL